METFNILLTPPRIGDLGGVEAHTLHLAMQLARDGNKVSVLCASEPAGSLGKLRDYSAVRLLKTAFKIQNTNITPFLPFALAKENAGIIHTMVPTPWSSDWSALIAKIRGRRLIVTIHSDLFSPSLIGGIITKAYVKTFYRLLLSLADKIIIVNPEYAKTFAHTGALLHKFVKKIAFIPNGVDTGVFRRATRKRNGKSILFVSVLDEFHEFKGLSYLIDAMKIVAEKEPKAILTIVGGGPLKEKYQKIAKGLGLGKNILFAGPKPNGELPRFYAKSDCFVLPSVDTESFGIVLLEAMASGTPVVTTEYAGMRKKIIDKNCGVVVPSRDSGALAEAILKVLKNKKLRESMGKNAAELAGKDYSWKTVAVQTEKVYSEVFKA